MPTTSDIGIAKGNGKNMVAVIGVTNAIDTAGIEAAASGKGEMPSSMILEDRGPGKIRIEMETTVSKKGLPSKPCTWPSMRAANLESWQSAPP